MGKRLIILLLLVLPFLAKAQERSTTPTAGLAFGIFAHSYGFGVDARYLLPRGRNEFYFGLSLASYKHPKELKITSAYADQGGKSYVYDKLNYCYVLAPMVGWSHSLIARNLFNRVGVSVTVGAGPLLALLKPYYVEVAVPFSGNTATVEVHPYDPSQYNYGNIYGSADYFLGMNEIRIQPGARAKVGTLIDLSAGSTLVRAIELSLFADAYAKKLPIFGANPNKQFFIGGSIEIMVGNIW